MPTNLIEFADFASLRSYTTFSSGDVVYVACNDTAEDGGEGTFQYDSTMLFTDNNGAILKPDSVSVGSSGRWVRLFSGVVNVRWFGAKGDGLADDSTAIQTAVDYAIYISRASDVYLPSGNYKISKTIQLGYGVTYNGSAYTYVRFCGPGPDFTNFSKEGANLVPTFSNAPAINIQAARGTRVERIGIIGLNYTWVDDKQLWFGASAPLLPSSTSSWADPSLDASATSRFAPYAGICIDGYSAPTIPSPSYPPICYPDWLPPVMTQYDKGWSSLVTIEGCWIVGFVAGIVVSPSGDIGTQGDFVSFQRCWIANCVYGISVCHTDARENSCIGNYINQCHTGITTSAHGQQKGLWGAAVVNTAFDRMYQIFEMIDNAGSRCGPVTFLNCYGENLYRIGDYGLSTGSVSDSHALIFESCNFGFSAQGCGNIGYPTTMLEMGLASHLQVNGGCFKLYKKAFVIAATAIFCDFRGTGFFIDDTALPTATYQKTIHSASAGQVFIVATAGVGTRPNTFEVKFTSQYNYDGTLSSSYGLVPNICGTNRMIPICIHSYWFSGSLSNNVHRYKRGFPANPRSSFASLSLVGTTLTFDFTGRNDDAFETNGPAPGDVLYDLTSKSVFYVRARTGITVTAELQNNYYLDGSTVVLLVPFDLVTGLLAIMCCRDFSPANPLFANMSNASANLTNATSADGSTTVLSDVAMNDRLFSDPKTESYTTVSASNKIGLINTTTKVITMGGNLGRTFTDAIELPAWILPPLPNA